MLETRILKSDPPADAGQDALTHVLRHRHERLNQLGGEGWQLATTVVVGELVFVDTLTRQVSA